MKKEIPKTLKAMFEAEGLNIELAQDLIDASTDILKKERKNSFKDNLDHIIKKHSK